MIAAVGVPLRAIIGGVFDRRSFGPPVVLMPVVRSGGRKRVLNRKPLEMRHSLCDRLALQVGGIWIGLLLVGGCNTSTPSSDFKTYEELLSENGDNREAKPDLNNGTEADSVEAVADAAETDPEMAADATGVRSGVSTADEPANGTTATAEEVVDIPATALAPLNVVDGASTSDILQVADRTSRPVSAAEVVAAAESAGPREIRLLVPNRDFRAEGPRGALRVSYDDLDLLKVLNMEPVPDNAPTFFPEWLSALDGQPVRIRGFMYPTFESSGIEQFVLARDNQICCFGRDPKVYDLIAVTLKPKTTTNYIPNRPFDVVGIFKVDMLAEGGKPLGLYWLEDAQVIDR